MNIICVLILNLSINILAVPIFDLHSSPNWSNITDFTNRQCFNAYGSNMQCFNALHMVQCILQVLDVRQ